MNVGESGDEPEIAEIESFLEEVSKVFIYENSGDTDFKKTALERVLGTQGRLLHFFTSWVEPPSRPNIGFIVL